MQPNAMTDGINPSLEYQKLMSIGESLSNSRWRRYCEGLNDEKRFTTAILLENLRQFIGNMDETTRIMQIGNFDKFAKIFGMAN